MKERCISYQTSKLAKEKGFPDYECTRYYTSDGSIVSANWVDIYEPKEYYPIVTQSLLQKWLRDEHKIHIEMQWFIDGTYEAWLVGDMFEYEYEADSEEATYEDCLEKGLYGALECIKKA